MGFLERIEAAHLRHEFLVKFSEGDQAEAGVFGTEIVQSHSHPLRWAVSLLIEAGSDAAQALSILPEDWRPDFTVRRASGIPLQREALPDS